MKGRLVVPYSLVWAVLVGAAVVGGSGCTSTSGGTDLDPEGPPTVKQVFVNARSGNGLPNTNEPLDAFGANNLAIINGSDLALGILRDVGQCTFDDQCPTADGFPAGYTCNTELRICLAGDGQQTAPGGGSLLQDAMLFRNATTAATVANGFPIIEIVFKELLDPATVEQFTCSCAKIINVAANGAVSLTNGNCGGGTNFTTDLSCSSCPDNPDTADSEAGTCFDINTDGVFDLPALLPGLVTITCPGTNFSYTNGTVSCATVNAAGNPAAVAPGTCDGFYDPSGNQIVTVDNGYLGLGPRLYLYPGVAGPFPADSDCELTISNTIKDKQGEALVAPGPLVRWHTESVQRIAADPEGAPVGEPPPEVPAPERIEVIFSTRLDPASIAPDTITVTAEPEPQTTPPTPPVVVPGTTTVDMGDPTTTPPRPADPTRLVWTPAAPLAEDQKYTVTIAAGVADTFGKALASDDVFVFVVVPEE
jgi:hypothetical protein